MDANEYPKVPLIEDALRTCVKAMLRAGKNFVYLPGQTGRFIVLGNQLGTLLCLKMDNPDAFYEFSPKSGKLDRRVILYLKPVEKDILAAALLNANCGH